MCHGGVKYLVLCFVSSVFVDSTEQETMKKLVILLVFLPFIGLSSGKQFIILICFQYINYTAVSTLVFKIDLQILEEVF